MSSILVSRFQGTDSEGEDNSHAEFDRTESSVKYYCRRMPAVFAKALNATVWDENGVAFTDFLAGCGSLNYGHNHPALKARIMGYLGDDGIINGLDLHTTAKRDFIRTFRETVLRPRGLSYRVQFPGPTGTNAVEAALKLARKVTGRRGVVAFTNAFHGMTLGALSVTGNQKSRAGAGVPLGDVTRLPYEGYLGAGTDELDRFAAMAGDPSGGVESPAAFILETVQGEGGLNVASKAWLRHLSRVARDLGAILIVDDIQAGCGRTGAFFSFERAGLEPDIICLAKSISGIGLPFSLVLMKPELDQWAPGEHNGTFRGNNLAFVSATAALELWRETEFLESLSSVGRIVGDWIDKVCEKLGPEIATPRGVGLMSGIAFTDQTVAGMVADDAYRHRILIETSGPHDEVLKLMPPFTIEPELLEDGLRRLDGAITDVLARFHRSSAA